MAGTATVLFVTRNGPYVSPDAVSYIGTARGLAAGDGFTSPPGTPPVGHFAPLYPVVLASGDLVGIDAVDAARWLNALLLGATVLVVGLVLRRATGDWWPALLACVLVTAATDVLAYYSSALSDPLFALLTLLTVVALAAYIAQRRPLLLGVAAALTALAFLTRYAGIALVAAGVITLVAFGSRRKRRGAIEAAIFAGVAALPSTAWVAWARGTHGRGSEGDVVLHLFHGRYLARGAANVFEWVVPDWAPWPLGLAAIIVLAAMIAWAARPMGDGAHPTTVAAAEPLGADFDRGTLGRLPNICAIFAAAYVTVLLLDRLLLDASALLDKRLLFPLHLVAILGLFSLVRPRRAWRRPAGLVTVVVIVLFVQVQLWAALDWARPAMDDGGSRQSGYLAQQWRDSSVVNAVRRLPPGVPVYTNGPDAIWFLTGRSTKMLPAEEDYLTGETNPRYGAQVAAMAARLRAEHGFVVYFPAIRSRHTLPTVADLRRMFPLQQVSSDPVGRIYTLAG